VSVGEWLEERRKLLFGWRSQSRHETESTHQLLSLVCVPHRPLAALTQKICVLETCKQPAPAHQCSAASAVKKASRTHCSAGMSHRPRRPTGSSVPEERDMKTAAW
jgi:hypothetical protein